MSNITINLDKKNPVELKMLLILVQTGPMNVSEKDYWVKEINARLNGTFIDPEKSKRIQKEIEDGMADIGDIGN